MCEREKSIFSVLSIHSMRFGVWQLLPTPVDHTPCTNVCGGVGGAASFHAIATRRSRRTHTQTHTHTHTLYPATPLPLPHPHERIAGGALTHGYAQHSGEGLPDLSSMRSAAARSRAMARSRERGVGRCCCAHQRRRGAPHRRCLLSAKHRPTCSTAELNSRSATSAWALCQKQLRPS